MPNKITYTVQTANTQKPVEYWNPYTKKYQDTNPLISIPAGTYSGLKARLKGSNPEIIATWSQTVTVTDLIASPVITGFTPISGMPGSTIIITGDNFTDATLVSINNGAVTSFVVDSPTQITAVLNSNQVTGRIRVTTSRGTGVSDTDFTVTSTSTPVPTISSFSPTNGQVGTTVTVVGTNLANASALSFHGVSATASITDNTATSLKFKVPAGATTGNFSVVTANGSATTATNFTVNPTIYTKAGTVTGGDSIFNGYNLDSPNTQRFDAQLQAILPSENFVSFSNSAVNGQYLRVIETQVTGLFLNYINSLNTAITPKVIVLNDAGANDIMQYGTNATELMRLRNSVTNQIKAGITTSIQVVFIATPITPNGNMYGDGGQTVESYEAIRSAFNANLLANYKAYGYDYYANFNSDTRLINMRDARYFGKDNQHPSLAGTIAMAQVVAPYMIAAVQNIDLAPKPDTVKSLIEANDNSLMPDPEFANGLWDCQAGTYILDGVLNINAGYAAITLPNMVEGANYYIQAVLASNSNNDLHRFNFGGADAIYYNVVEPGVYTIPFVGRPAGRRLAISGANGPAYGAFTSIHIIPA